MPKPTLETVGEITVRRWPKMWTGDRTINEAFTKINYNDSAFDVPTDDVSEISNPFEDVTREENVQKRILKSDIKLKADKEFMEKFTDDYKRSMSLVRNEMGLDESMLFEDPEHIRLNAASYEEIRKAPHELRAHAEELLKDVDVDISIKASKVDSKNVLERADAEVYDNRSAIWRMLEANEDFKVSMPGHDAFHGPKPHWLQQEEVPLAVREEARSKCLAWLQKSEPPLQKRQSAKKETHTAPRKSRVVMPRAMRK